MRRGRDLSVTRHGGIQLSLRRTYAYSVDMAQKMGVTSIDERDGKLHFKGTVATQEDANKIWDAIKTIPTWSKDVVADIHARPFNGGASPTAPGAICHSCTSRPRPYSYVPDTGAWPRH
jgi:hypothetical protein